MASGHQHHTMTCRCGQPVNGTTLCSKCTHTVRIALSNIAAYHADFEIVATRRRAVRYDLPRGKGGVKSLPLILDHRFLPDGRGPKGDQPGAGYEAKQLARTTLGRWVRRCFAAWPAASTPLRDNVNSCCAYLVQTLPRIAVAVWAEDFMDAVLNLERALLRVDASRPEKIYCGLCFVCLVAFDQTALYAAPGDEFVTCRAPDCGMTYSVEERRNAMLDALEYEWMTAAKIADLATYLGLLGDREWSRKKLNRWHSDGMLMAASANDAGEPLFPWGEASRLLLSADSRRRSGAPRDTLTRA